MPAGRIVARLLAPLRTVRALGLATGKLVLSSNNVDAASDLLDGDARIEAFRVTEAIPEAAVLDIDARAPHRAIDTTFVCLDSESPDLSLRNNHLIGPGRVVISERRAPFAELPVSLDRLHPVTYLPGTTAYLSNSWVDNYYHWMCFVLPNLRILHEVFGVAPDRYYVGTPLKRGHLETLAAFGISADRVVSRGTISDRIVACFPDRAGALDSASVSFVRKAFRADDRRSTGRRIFIGRGRTKHRRLLNEDACTQLLREAYDFEIFTMDGLTVTEQADLVASASVIVAPHGAALTNLLFASSDARVLELVPNDASAEVYAYFAEICAAIGCTYGQLAGEPLAARAPRPNMQDLLIDVDALDRSVAALLEQEEVAIRPRARARSRGEPRPSA